VAGPMSALVISGMHDAEGDAGGVDVEADPYVPGASAGSGRAGAPFDWGGVSSREVR